MTELGRESQRLLGQAVKALERNAQATEKMLAIAEREQIQFDYQPPQCPHCGVLNPNVTQLNEKGSGPLADFVMQAEAHCCNRVIFVVPTMMTTTNSLDLALEVQRQMKGGK